MALESTPTIKELFLLGQYWAVVEQLSAINPLISTLFSFAGFILIPNHLPGESYAPFQVFTGIFKSIAKTLGILILSSIIIGLFAFFIKSGAVMFFFMALTYLGPPLLAAFFALVLLCCMISSLIYSGLYFLPVRDIFWNKVKDTPDNESEYTNPMDHIKRL